MPRLGQPPVHAHSGNGVGGQLDWDNVWTDAVHSHVSNAEGGVLSSPGSAIDLDALLEAILKVGRWRPLPPNAGWTIAKTGSAAETQNAGRLELNTGATAGSTGRLYTLIYGLSVGADGHKIDWTDRIIMAFVLMQDTTTPNGIARVVLGKGADEAVGNPTTRSIGVRVDGAALKGLAHDGTSLTVVNLNTNLTLDATHLVVIVSDGAGNIEWFIDGASKGTTAAGPKTLGLTNEAQWQFEVDNGADAVAYDLHQVNAWLYAE